MSSNPSDLTFTDVISPGRINLIGEHTDYNDGYVLPAAIELHIKIHLEKNESEDKCRIYSKTLQAHVEADLRNLHPGSGWENYILGVLNEIQKWGGKLQGFDGSIDSVLPPGAGLSSSAALECGLTFGLNKLFSLGLDPLELSNYPKKQNTGMPEPNVASLISSLALWGARTILSCWIAGPWNTATSQPAWNHINFC
jgi:galactokinase